MLSEISAALFKIKLFVFLPLNFKGCLCILDANPLSDMCFVKKFLLVCDLFFMLLTVPFVEQDFKIRQESNILIFLSWIMLWALPRCSSTESSRGLTFHLRLQSILSNSSEGCGLCVCEWLSGCSSTVWWQCHPVPLSSFVSDRDCISCGLFLGCLLCSVDPCTYSCSVPLCPRYCCFIVKSRGWVVLILQCSRLLLVWLLKSANNLSILKLNFIHFFLYYYFVFLEPRAWCKGGKCSTELCLPSNFFCKYKKLGVKKKSWNI